MTMTEQKKQFTGVWIPREILEDTELTADEKMLFADIASFTECFMSNAFLSKRYGCSERTIQDRIKKLKTKGFVVQNGFDGRKRYLQAAHISHLRHAISRTPDTRNLAPIDNSIDNSILSETSVSQNEPILEVSDKPPKKKKLPDIPKQVYEVFGDVLGKNPLNWRTNKTQRTCAENLFKERGIKQIRKALLGYEEYRGEKFCPAINSPYDLDSKWSNLYEFIKSQQ